MNNRFERKEKKYMLTREQYNGLMSQMPDFIVRDAHSESMIRSVYYDLDSYELIRRSVEKPFYKEKLRARSYGIPDPQTKVFVEVKKKLDGIVYKRRSTIRFDKLCKNDFSQIDDPQIRNEILAFRSVYGNLKPVCLISCRREYWHDERNHDFRITFDTELGYSLDKPKLDYSGELNSFFEDNRVLMEVKMVGAMPLWLARLFSKYSIYPHPFSKIGYVYLNYILKRNGV